MVGTFKLTGCLVITVLNLQELLHRISGVNAGISMDEQKREGNVPMHQAKVLDRRHRTADVASTCDSVLGDDVIGQMVRCVEVGDRIWSHNAELVMIRRHSTHCQSAIN